MSDLEAARQEATFKIVEKILDAIKEERKAYEEYWFNEMRNESVLQAKFDDGVEKIINAMRKVGINEEDIKRALDNIDK